MPFAGRCFPIGSDPTCAKDDRVSIDDRGGFRRFRYFFANESEVSVAKRDCMGQCGLRYSYMTALLFKLTGGIGLFLLGMVLLTDGLKAFAGDALRRALVKFTGNPLKAFVSGCVVTLMVQSSSATTVAVIGFVSAGLLTFPQAVGVVIGASLGTTGTGWIVAELGLKVSVGFYALPLVGTGAFMNLLGNGRWKALGMALAGFGLIFVGIETLQEGMNGLAGVFNFAGLPQGGFLSVLLMVMIGIAMTLIMQSSSAAVATTLTALHTGGIHFEQATALVIGAAVGTTVTGVLAAIGGNVSAKRTALAHVTFNAATGLIALVMLPFFQAGIAWAQTHIGMDPGATSLAAFHTSFIALGVLVFLPFVRKFSIAIERWLPDRGPSLTRHLDPTLVHLPEVALEASHRALKEIAGESYRILRARLEGRWGSRELRMSESIRAALDATQGFIAGVPAVGVETPMAQSRLDQLHAVDHLVRLTGSFHPSPGIMEHLSDERMKVPVSLCVGVLVAAGEGVKDEVVIGAESIHKVEDGTRELSAVRRRERPLVLEEAAEGKWDSKTALEVLDAMRWLDTIGYHVWRISNHLAGRQSIVETAF